MFKGIDVSVWQGSIDWEKVKGDGVDFAMIREGYGKRNSNQVDKYFHSNVKGAKGAGIHCGVYHYSYALTADDAVEEAKFCLENIKGYSFEYPIAFDIEDSSMISAGKRVLTDICKAFCNEIEKAGYYAVIYCNPNWLNSYLYQDELLSRYDIWFAQWGSKEPSYECGIWQYTDCGRVSGIIGNVDMNISYKDYKSIMESAGLNFVKSGNSSQGSGNSQSDSLSFELYTVKKGDTLWNIAKTFLGSGVKYIQIKDLNLLVSDTIYPGQVLKIPK